MKPGYEQTINWMSLYITALESRLTPEQIDKAIEEANTAERKA